MIQESEEALTGLHCGGERAAVAIQSDPGFSDERPYPEAPSDRVSSSSGPGAGDGSPNFGRQWLRCFSDRIACRTPGPDAALERLGLGESQCPILGRLTG